MRIVVGLASLCLIVTILVDVFEAVLLPRRVSHGFRYLRFYYYHTWRAWRRLDSFITSPQRRETMLSLFGPLALLVLFATWAIVLIFAFAGLHWALRTPMSAGGAPAEDAHYVYFSGVTFFTLGYGDFVPMSSLGRFMAVVETGLGFGFLAIVISYHPVLTQAFSRREIVISLLDARGGSPPTAAQILIRSHRGSSATDLNAELIAWEVWCAELLESSLSFPMLGFYRSQHGNQSWLAALTVILDTCAMQICGIGPSNSRQARLTCAIARHAAVDLTLVYKLPPVTITRDRLDQEHLARLKTQLGEAGITISNETESFKNLAELRKMYEPFLASLSHFFLMPLPEFVPDHPKADNWQTSSWMPRAPGILDLKNVERGEHFE